MNEYVNIYIKLVTKTATPRAPAGLRSLLKLGTKVGTKVGTKWVHFPENRVQKTLHYLCNAVKDYTRLFKACNNSGSHTKNWVQNE